LSQLDDLYRRLAFIALREFPDVVVGTEIVEGKLRIFIADDSFIDIWFSEKRKGVYAYHWERRMVDGTIYRHDNLPDREARKLETFPKHFHEGSEENIRESRISDDPEQAIRQFLTFVREVSEREHMSTP
jgi:hypothetical protein